MSPVWIAGFAMGPTHVGADILNALSRAFEEVSELVANEPMNVGGKRGVSRIIDAKDSPHIDCASIGKQRTRLMTCSYLAFAIIHRVVRKPALR